jgi:hypothetical protein
MAGIRAGAGPGVKRGYAVCVCVCARARVCACVRVPGDADGGEGRAAQGGVEQAVPRPVERGCGKRRREKAGKPEAGQEGKERERSGVWPENEGESAARGSEQG